MTTEHKPPDGPTPTCCLCAEVCTRLGPNSYACPQHGEVNPVWTNWDSELRPLEPENAACGAGSQAERERREMMEEIWPKHGARPV